MRVKLFVFFSLFVGAFFYGQTLLHVKDSLSQASLEGVRVMNTNDEILGATNNFGKYVLRKKSQDTLYLKLQGYTTHRIITKDLTPNNTHIIYLKTKPFQLEGIFVQGIKWKGSQNKEPQHITKLSEKEIKFSQSPTAADLLNRTGEVFIQKSQLGGGSPMIRGFSANRVLLTIDGIRLNNAIFRSGNIHNVIAIDPFALDGVEVIHGPGSLLYGSDAIGGVMNFSTETIYPSSKFMMNGRMNFRTSTAANEKTHHSSLAMSSQQWSSFTNITYTDFDDLKMGKNGRAEYLRPDYVIRRDGVDEVVVNADPYKQKYSGYSQFNALQKLIFQPNENLKISYQGIFSRTSDVPRYDRLLQRNDQTLRYAKWYYGPQQWMLHSLKLNYSRKNRFFDEFTSTFQYQNFKESRHNRKLNQNIRHNAFEKVNVWGWDNTFYKKWKENQQLTYGVDLFLNKVGSYAFEQNINTHQKTPTPSRYPDGATWDNYGVFVKYRRNVSPSIDLEAATRYSWVHSTSNFDNSFYDFPFEHADFSTGQLNASAGGVLRLPNKLTVKANVSSGFRAPNIDDIGKIFDSEPGQVIAPNPNLQSESIYTVDIGITKGFGKLAFLSLTGFYSYLDDAIVRRSFSLNGNTEIMYQGELSSIQALQNVASATVYGGVAALEINLGRHLKWNGKINYTKGEESSLDGTKVPLRHAAPLFGSTYLEFKRKKIDIQLSYDFSGEIKAEDMPPSERQKAFLYAKDENGLPFSPSWGILNLNSSYKINDYFSVQFGIENIFDKLYRPYSSGISAPGRNFMISVTTNF